MHIVHIVRVHNGDINDVKHDLMSSFVIMPLQGAITTKLMDGWMTNAPCVLWPG
jgi:hypothetical protein